MKKSSSTSKIYDIERKGSDQSLNKLQSNITDTTTNSSSNNSSNEQVTISKHVEIGGGGKQQDDDKKDWVPNLKRYVKVNRDKYDNLEEGSHLIYQKTSGKWVKGGYLRYISKKDGINRFQLESDTDRKTKKYMTWGIKYEDISELYRSIDVNNLQQVISELKIQKAEIDQLRKKCALLEKALISHASSINKLNASNK